MVATLRTIVLTVLISCGLLQPAFAQSMVGGVVRAPTGQVASGVNVVIEHVATGQTSVSRATSLGLYAFYNLPIGRHVITVVHPPDALFSATIDVKTNQKTALDIQLRIAGEEITVEGTVPPLSTLADGSVRIGLSAHPIEAAASGISGRTLQSAVSLSPGVVFTDAVGTQAQFTAAGQRRTENRLTVDGIAADLALDPPVPGLGDTESGALPATSTLGSTQTPLPLAALDDIQVSTISTAPEHARGAGARTIVVTRAGSDRLSGWHSPTFDRMPCQHATGSACPPRATAPHERDGFRACAWRSALARTRPHVCLGRTSTHRQAASHFSVSAFRRHPANSILNRAFHS